MLREEIIKRFTEAHGDKYDYSLVPKGDTKVAVKVSIVCPVHGVLYGEGKTKVGITYDPKERFRKLKERTPFEFEPVGVWFCNTYDLTFKVEAIIHRHFEEYSSKLKGFDGAKEWFNMTPFEVCDLLTAFLGVPVK